MHVYPSYTNNKYSYFRPFYNTRQLLYLVIQLIHIQFDSQKIIMSRGQASPRVHDIQKTQKILMLQEQLLNLRKQISKKQSQWEKEKSNLLSKNQIANIEIIQLKQRLANLAKINSTLTHAMTNPNQNAEQSSSKSRKLKVTVGENVNIAQDFYQDMQHNYENQTKKSRKATDQIFRMNKVIQEKDYQIRNLNKIGSQLRNKIQERNQLVSNLEEAVYTLRNKVQVKEEQILKAHKQIQQLEEKLQQNYQYIDDARRKSSQNYKQIHLNMHELDEPRKYSSKNSSYLIMKPTPDHSSYENDHNTSYIHQIDFIQPEPEFDDQSDQDQKLLCQVCSRVIPIGDFHNHARICKKSAYEQNNSAKHLFERKREIQFKLEKIKQEQQKQNLKSRFDTRFEFEDSKSNRQKINQIRQIAKGLQGKGKEYKKSNPYTDFSIKSNAFRH